MTTEQQLKDGCTPDMIKWMCELADGFEIIGDVKIYFNNVYSGSIKNIICNDIALPLLIHRAVEGWNKKTLPSLFGFVALKSGSVLRLCEFNIIDYKLSDYEPQSLTQSECAMLHCMQDIFKECQQRLDDFHEVQNILERKRNEQSKR